MKDLLFSLYAFRCDCWFKSSNLTWNDCWRLDMFFSPPTWNVFWSSPAFWSEKKSTQPWAAANFWGFQHVNKCLHLFEWNLAGNYHINNRQQGLTGPTLQGPDDFFLENDLFLGGPKKYIRLNFWLITSNIQYSSLFYPPKKYVTKNQPRLLQNMVHLEKGGFVFGGGRVPFL